MTTLSDQVANPPHLHVICCPYCRREVKIAECDLSRCNSPSESKSVNFPGSRAYDCQHCGKHFYASFGITDKLPSEIIFSEEKDANS